MSTILASNFMNIGLLDVTSIVCGERSRPCVVVATSSITINLNIVNSIKRQIEDILGEKTGQENTH
jgi:hypothetical protein